MAEIINLTARRQRMFDHEILMRECFLNAMAAEYERIRLETLHMIAAHTGELLLTEAMEVRE